MYYPRRDLRLRSCNLLFHLLSPCGKESPICICIHPTLSSTTTTPTLLRPTLNNSRRAVLILDGAAAGAAGLDALDDGVGLGVAVGDLAEDDVAAVEPGGHDGGDEELRAVRVGARVGHRQHEGLFVGQLEVLVGEFFAVDGFAAGALLAWMVSGVQVLFGGEGGLTLPRVKSPP